CSNVLGCSPAGTSTPPKPCAPNRVWTLLTSPRPSPRWWKSRWSSMPGRRYRLLETNRDYALERLARRGDVERCRDAHATYFTDPARQAMSGLRGRDEARWVDLVDTDWSNMRAAFRRAMDTGDAGAAAAIVVHLAIEGLFRRPEALSWCREASARFG